MTVQHKDIPDAQLHEPKGIVTATSKQIYLADGAGSGDWRKIRESDFDLTDKNENLFGWAYRKDSQYTSGAPLAIGSGVKTLLPNNGLHALTDESRPLGITYTSTYFTPSTLYSSYALRVAFKSTAAAAAGTPYTVKIILEGGAVPLQFAGQDQAIKGGGYVNDTTVTFLFFTGTLNTNNPIKIYLTPDTNINIYDIDYLVQRTYYEG